MSVVRRENKKTILYQGGYKIMRKSYERPEAKFVLLVAEDVITTSADFQDATTGDNGVWFPGSENGNQGVWNQ